MLGPSPRAPPWLSACTSSARSAVLVTGGHGESAVDHLFDGSEHLEISVERYPVAATHGAGCTHSATLAALLARGESSEAAARGAAAAASAPSGTGLPSSAPATGPSMSST